MVHFAIDHFEKDPFLNNAFRSDRLLSDLFSEVTSFFNFDHKKLRPFDSESKTTSGCNNSLISEKITPKSLFSFYQYKKFFMRKRKPFFKLIIFVMVEWKQIFRSNESLRKEQQFYFLIWGHMTSRCSRNTIF